MCHIFFSQYINSIERSAITITEFYSKSIVPIFFKSENFIHSSFFKNRKIESFA